MTSPSHALSPNRIEVALRWSVVAYAVVLVAVPLIVLVHVGLVGGASHFWADVTAPVARAALWLTAWTALLVAVINIFVGTATAWVLVRYRFAGRALLSALVDLPLAVPTLVAGLMLALLYGPTSVLGKAFEMHGIEVLFAPPGIVLALLFVSLPYVVRAVEPVLAELDPAEEEAAVLLGAGPARVFRTAVLPAILPATLSGGIRSFGRALGEFGSIVVVAGNIPFQTMTAPVFIFGEIESGASRTAAAVSTVLLCLALLVHGGARFVESRTGARRASR